MSNFFVGAHGTGKSTILKRIAETGFSKTKSGKPYFLTEGISRPINKALDTSGLIDVVSSYQKQILINELTVAQYLVQIENPYTLCTRSIIDIIVYSRVVFPDIDISGYQKIFNETVSKINNLYYIPIEFELHQDDVRKGIWSDRTIQKEIDLAFRNFLSEHSKHIKGQIISLSGSVEERTNSVLNYF